MGRYVIQLASQLHSQLASYLAIGWVTSYVLDARWLYANEVVVKTEGATRLDHSR